MFLSFFSLVGLMAWSFFLGEGSGVLIFCLSVVLLMFFGGGLYNEGPKMWMSEIFIYDHLTGLMVLMTVLVILSCLASGGKEVRAEVVEKCDTVNEVTMEKSSVGMNSAVLSAGVCAAGAFMSSNLLFFYFFFELSMIPTLWILLSGGKNPERYEAAIVMVLFTVCGSVPFFLYMMCSYCKDFTSMSFNFIFFKYHYGSSLDYKLTGVNLMWLAMSLPFLIKLPIFSFHVWLPKAHVEAPLSGSMLLAGLLLKLGGYGLMRVFWLWSSTELVTISESLMVLALLGGLYSYSFCLFQANLKSLIAYTSISHMSFVLVGILSSTEFGWSGSVCLMFGHAMSSCMLFSVVSAMDEWVHSQMVPLVKGLGSTFPEFSLFWCGACFLGMSLPPSLGFCGEVELITSGVFVCELFSILYWFSSFFSGVVGFYLYTTAFHGGVSELALPMSYLNPRYVYAGFFMGFPLAVGGFAWADFFML